MSIFAKLCELARVADRAPKFAAVAAEPEDDPAILKISRRAAETDEPQIVVGITRGKHGGMDIVTTANGREISRRPYRG